MEEKMEHIKNTQEWLDELWVIMHSSFRTQADKLHYQGAVECLAFMGFNWTRDENGRHRIYGLEENA